MIGTFIKRPVFTTMFILLLVVFGIRCYPDIGVDLNPDVDLPIVSVRVTYSGASPQEMETLVTKPIENRVSQVSGIKTLSSTVLEGYSETVLEFNIERPAVIQAGQAVVVSFLAKAFGALRLLAKQRFKLRDHHVGRFNHPA